MTLKSNISARFRSSNVVYAAFLMMLTGIFFGLMNVVIREIGTALHTFEVVFFRNLFAAVFMLPWALRHVETIRQAKRLDLHVMRSLVGIIAMYLFFYSLTILPVADTVALSFTAPLFVLVGAALFLGETVKIRRWLATLVGFCGVLIIVQPGTAGFNPDFAYPLLSSLFMAFSLLMVKLISRNNEPNVMVFIMALITTSVSLFPMLFVWITPTPMQWVWLFSLGVLGALAHICFTTAFKIAETSVVVPFDYLRLPFSALFAYLWFAQVPTASMWLGAGVIVSAAIYIAHREAKLARAENQSLSERRSDEAGDRAQG